MDWVEPGKCSPIWCKKGATSDESRSPPGDENDEISLPPVLCKWKRLLGIIKETQKKTETKKKNTVLRCLECVFSNVLSLIL